jgi:FAD/FMN-containing dehydrogenase
MRVSSLTRDLAAIIGERNLLDGAADGYGSDATYEILGLRGVADAVVRPGECEEVPEVLGWCYAHQLAIIPGGAAPASRALRCPSMVASSSRSSASPGCSFEPRWWRAEVESGLSTATVGRLARESGLLFARNPGATEQSQIGAMSPPTPVTRGRSSTASPAVGSPVSRSWSLLGSSFASAVRHARTSPAYNLRSLVVGSEGTLGIITAFWLRFVPAPQRTHSAAAFYPDAAAGCAAIAEIVGSGLVPAAV